MKKNYLALVLILFVLPFFAQNIPNYVPKDGLVGYWPFNGNANDESGHGNHGVVNGAQLTNDRNLEVNKAYEFDGTSSGILINSAPENTFKNKQMTLSIWVNLVDYNDFQQIVWMNNKGIMKTSGNELRVYDGNSFYATVNADTVKYGNWFNVVAVYNNDTIGIYINGIKYSYGLTWGKAQIIYSNDPIQLGFYSGKTYRVKGKLDDFAIYNRILSDYEIKALFSGCIHETASSSSFNSLLLSTGSSVSISAEPQGGVFRGTAVEKNQFIPSKAKIGLNKVQYNFKNSQGCNDSTLFTMIVADTVGTHCKKYDTITVIKYDTISLTDTVSI